MDKTENKTYEFVGIPSGDGSSFCWDVDKETFIRITSKKPDRFDKSDYNKGLYKIYPNEFHGMDHVKCKLTISVEVE